MNSNTRENSSKTALIIKKACDELGLRSKFIDRGNIVLMVDLSGKSHIFVANNTGLNDEVVRKICNDKFYTYLLLGGGESFMGKEGASVGGINLPKTFSFIDPNADDIYQDHSILGSNKQVVEEIFKNHKFPILLIANRFSRGLNVFKCKNAKEVALAVNKIFNKKSKNYDHVLISQDYIEIAEEYRVVVYNQEIMFVYRKDVGGSGVGGDESAGDANTSVKFIGNLSPLHWENSKAVVVDDKKIIDELRNFIKPIFLKLKLRYGGLDIARDSNGQLLLIEINTQPGFSYFIKDNSDDMIFKMFKKILQDLKK